MKIFAVAAVLLFLLVVKGSDVPEERKRVGCYYLGAITVGYGTLYPEDIDASICTHLIYLHGAINNETEEIFLRPMMRAIKTGGKSFVPRLAALKEVNPDLKVGLHIVHRQFASLVEDPSKRANFIQNSLKWLNESKFDGLEISAPTGLERTDKIADLICEMKNEFDKHGYWVSSSFTGATEIAEESMRKIARCSDHITLITDIVQWGTYRMAPMSIIKPDVARLTLRGIPASKISISVPALGLIFVLEDPEDTKLGAAVYGPGNENRELMDGEGIPNKELIRRMNNSSLGWTIRRDNVTMEPYAFTNTGLWTSYEDAASAQYKVRFVTQEGLGGINIVAIDFDDPEGIGEEGRFPLTRIVYNNFRGNKSVTNRL